MSDFRITGASHNYFKKISVTNTGFGSVSDGYKPDVFIPFSTATISFLNEGTTTSHVIEYSFDGFNVHGEINPTLPNRYSVFQNRVASKIWFRIKTGSSGPVSVAVEAWQIR